MRISVGHALLLLLVFCGGGAAFHLASRPWAGPASPAATSATGGSAAGGSAAGGSAAGGSAAGGSAAGGAVAGGPAAGAPSTGPAASGPRAGDEAARRRAAERGLAWLRRAQEEDGSWDLARWNPWHGRPGLAGFSEEDHWFTPAATALALLAFLEAQAPGSALDPAVEKGLARLAGWQAADGRVGVDEETADTWFREKMKAPGLASPDGPGYKALTLHTFNHVVPAAAFAVAARRTRDPRWTQAARHALAHLVADEHPEYRWTAYLDPENDIGSAAYVALAARAAADAGLAAEAAPILTALPDYLDRVTDNATGRTRMLSDVPVCFDGDDSTAINAYARRLLGQRPDVAPLRLALASLCLTPPVWAAAALPAPAGPAMFHEHLGPVVNHDAWTYAVRALAQVPGNRAEAQRTAIRQLLLDNQVPAGEHEGSWEPIGVWDRVGGRLYATAMAVRALLDP